MATDEVLQARLEEAESALHKLNMGQSVVSISYEGHETQYNRTNVAQLERYVRKLKRELGQPVGSLSRKVYF